MIASETASILSHLDVGFFVYLFFYSEDKRDYALKQIEGCGISMSACREIAVSKTGPQGLSGLHPHHVSYESAATMCGMCTS